MQRPWPQHSTAWTVLAALLALAAALLFPLRVGGQQPPGPGMPAPRILLVMPCGGQTGSTFEVTVTGQDLDGATGLHFSHPGIKAEPLGTGTAPEVAVMTKGKQPGKKPPSARTSQRFRVTVPADAPLGTHDVRLVNKWGVSNPRAFVVGDLKEFVEHEPNDDVPQGQRVELNATVSGIISSPTDVDYYLFAGKKGQRVVVSCLTTAIDSRLPAAVQLYSAGGSYLGFNRNYRDNNAVLDAVLPDDGDYYVRVASFAHTLGGLEYFYRLTISTAPWIDAVYPPMVAPGKETKVTVWGRNLPGGKADPSAVVDGRVLDKLTVTVKPPADERAGQRLAYTGHVAPSATSLDGFELRLRNDTGRSNPVLLTYAHAPVVLDNEANDTPETAQRVTLPCEIAGRFEKKADRDWYAFTARKGEVWSIEGYAERLGAPFDLFLELHRAGSGKSIVELDDNPEILSPQLFTRSDDPPRYRFVVPADGDYVLQVGSRTGFTHSGPRHVYRVRIAPERPDFRVIAMPPGANLPDAAIVQRGGHQVWNLLVWRLDGFNGEITVTAEDLPPGVAIPPQVIPAGAKQAPLVVSASMDAEEWVGAVRLLATARVGGKTLAREVRAATATWPTQQPNVPTISRLDRELVLGMRGRAPYSLTAVGERFVVAAGGQVKVPLKLTRLSPELKGPVQVAALNPPGSLTFKALTLPPGKDTAEAVFDVKANATPGLYTVVLRGQAQSPFVRDTKVKGKQVNLTLMQPSTPITIRILPKEVAKLTVTPAAAKLKVGGRMEVLVKVARLNAYEGEFKVRLLQPPGSRGLSAEEATIPAGADEVRLVLTADANAGTGVRPNLTVEAVALVDGAVSLTHRAKLSVSVSR